MLLFFRYLFNSNNNKHVRDRINQVNYCNLATEDPKCIFSIYKASGHYKHKYPSEIIIYIFFFTFLNISLETNSIIFVIYI